jgi:two-component system, LytTR family, response regulator
MRILIVDDERRARDRLIKLLHTMEGIEICAQAGDGVEALEAIEKEKPDVVLLDVQMPQLDGFEVIRELRGRQIPLIIFVTAYDQYALRAFEVSATDYLLKPVSNDRLQQALTKAERLLQTNDSARTGASAEQLRQLAAALSAARPPYLQRLVGHRAQKISILAVSDVQAFLSENELVFAQLAEGRVLVNRTLKELEAQLDPDQFVRIHKQTIVNLACVSEIDPLATTGALAKLRCGLSVGISRRYAAALRVKLGW